MTESHMVDITELAVLGEQFPLRSWQLGFRLMQIVDDRGQDQFRFILPPVVTVPAGSFLMGNDDRKNGMNRILARSAEKPQHTVTLPAYEISVFPLTVSEYAGYVEATNREPPEKWDDQQYHPDHPVVYVSWYDVLAYAQWLAQVTGQAWRMPTEAQWEKAARGTDGRNYPWDNHWDNTWANTKDGGPKATTPVGSYPSGASPYGAQDMAGNVREWTSTTYRPYPYQATDGRENLSNPAIKVLRGGSWGFYSQEARAACRYYCHPNGTSSDWGVRLVRVGVAG